MRRTIELLLSKLSDPNVGVDLDESMWSPSGWSEAVTGAARRAEFTSPPRRPAIPMPAADEDVLHERKAA